MTVHTYVRGSLPVAVLLLYYSDFPTTQPLPENDNRLPSRKTFVDFITPKGKGGLAEYYRDVSRGAIDLTGSDVFGWWKMGFSFAKDSGTRDRGEMMDEAIRVANEHGVDLDYYRGGILMFTNGNAIGGGALTARKVVPFHIGGPWWTSQNDWRVCRLCNVVTYTVGQASAVCAAAAGGQHQYDFLSPVGSAQQREYSMFAGREGKVFRRCSKCAGLVSESEPGNCPNGDQHSWRNDDLSIQVPESTQKKGVPIDDFRQCVKCNCLTYGGTHLAERTDANGNIVRGADGKPIMDSVANSTSGVCLVNSGGRFGSAHLFDMVVAYSLSLRYWNEFHLAVIAHEFGHMLGMSESWRAKLPTSSNAPEDVIYGDSYDLMSAMRISAFDESQGSRFKISPVILNAAALLKFGWLRRANFRTYNFGIGLPSIAPGGSSTQSLYSLSTQEPVKRPLNQDDTVYGNDDIQAIIITSPNHTYTVEYRTKTGWDRGIGRDTVLIHETRSDFIAGEKGWTQCTKCSALWQASSSGCANGMVHEYSSDQASLVIFESSTNAAQTQTGWASCSQCLTLYHTGQPGFCPGTYDGLGPHAKLESFRVQMNNFSAPGNSDWLWCRKCQSMFLGGKKYGKRAGVCPTGGTHDSTGSAMYTIAADNVDNRTVDRQSGWKTCKKCNCLCYTEYQNRCLAGGGHSRAANNSAQDFGIAVRGRGIAPSIYEYGWRRCIACAQLVYTGSGQGGICTVPQLPFFPPLPRVHKFATTVVEYGMTTEAVGDPVNKMYSTVGRKCAKCLAMVLADWNGNMDAACPGGGKHDIAASSHYNIVSFDRDFTYLVGRDGTPVQGNREYEFLSGDTFEDAKIGLKLTIGAVNAATGKIDITVSSTG